MWLKIKEPLLQSAVSKNKAAIDNPFRLILPAWVQEYLVEIPFGDVPITVAPARRSLPIHALQVPASVRIHAQLYPLSPDLHNLRSPESIGLAWPTFRELAKSKTFTW